MLRALTLAAVLIGCNGDKNAATGDTAPTTTNTGPTEITDQFKQTMISPVDILFVVDRHWTEGLSALDIDTLNDEFELFLLADPNWKMGILDSTAGGSNFGLIQPQFSFWPTPSSPFGTKPAQDSSRVREAIHLALELRKDSIQNRDFIRSDAGLYVIVFTDSEDASQNPPPGTGITSEISQKDFDKWFTGFEPSDTKRLSVITTADAKKYWSKHLQGGGILYDVGSFRKAIRTVFLDAIGQQTAFTLTQTPVDPPETVSVVYRDRPTEYALHKDYQYDRSTNTISFDKVIPPIDSTIEVTYVVDAGTTSATSTAGTSN